MISAILSTIKSFFDYLSGSVARKQQAEKDRKYEAKKEWIEWLEKYKRSR